ncbi:MAG: molybdopterin cofactor-binding domain-containing protein [Acidobacteriota bacterium]
MDNQIRRESGALGPWSLDRRNFLKAFTGGIIVFVSLDFSLEAQESRTRGYPTDPNAYLKIGEDGRVTVYTGKVELGQGVITSLAQMAADELGVALESIDMVMGDTDLCPPDMGTFGSMSIRFFGPALRAAAAEARAVLVDLASQQLKAPAQELGVDKGVVFVKADASRKATFARLAAGRKIARLVDRKAVIKSVAEFQVMGKSFNRVDARAKVTGEAKYAGDIRLPDMLYARLVRPPAHGAKLLNVDTSAAEKVPGVTVVKQDGLIAVLHADPEVAAKALAAVKAEFDIPRPAMDTESIFDYLVEHAPAPREGERRGDLVEGEKASASLFEHTYVNGYGAHTSIETHTALARVEGWKATVWAATQTPFPARQEVSNALGFPLENVRVITPFVGGGFGGKSSGGQHAVEAARLAKATGKPVQVTWTRAEEFFYDSFRPAAVVKIKSGIDQSGKLSLWDYRVYFAGSRSAEQFYDVPHNLIRTYGGWRGAGTEVHPFSVGPWRAPGANINVFARESQIDIMAAKAKTDPLEFRLNNTTDKRMREVLRVAAEHFGWKPAPAPSGRGYGIACGIDAGTYVATIAEVQVDNATGRVKVKRIVCAQEMGIVINPEGATLQMEGCITMGLGYALAEELRFRGGEVLDRNFDTYEVPRFSWLPQIETVLAKNDELTPQGGGEPAIVPIGAVIANAIFDACGARLFRMPLTPARVLAATAKT